ncbi:MAG: SapC family protein [Alphaproteobacteria bacterium]|nr:SapC family protein [Alphaproteobacteria bacterium]
MKAAVDFSRLEKDHILPIVAHEFISVANDAPVIFIKHEETGRFVPAALLGLKPGENLIVSKDGTWTAQYVPGIVATYPFRLMSSEHDQTQLIMAIDEDADCLSRDEGIPLFDENGKETEFMQNREVAVQTYFEHNQVTDGFIRILTELELLNERTLTVEAGGDKINLNGIYAIDEVKLNTLPDDKFSDLRQRGFLPAIYAHLISLNQIRRLGLLYSQRHESEA